MKNLLLFSLLLTLISCGKKDLPLTSYGLDVISTNFCNSHGGVLLAVLDEDTLEIYCRNGFHLNYDYNKTFEIYVD